MMGLNILLESITYDGVDVLKWNLEVKPLLFDELLKQKKRHMS
jgi:hypothetical protein